MIKFKQSKYHVGQVLIRKPETLILPRDLMVIVVNVVNGMIYAAKYLDDGTLIYHSHRDMDDMYDIL